MYLQATLITCLVGALLMFCGDMLLYYDNLIFVAYYIVMIIHFL